MLRNSLVIALLSVIGILRPIPSFAGVLITFDEIIFPENSPITNEYAGFGVTFSNSYYDVQGWNLPTGHHIANFSPSITYPYLGISFAERVSDASCLFITNKQDISTGPPGQTIFQALLDGSIVAQYIADTDLTERTFGFSNLRFNEMRIYPGGSGNYGRLDNLQFTTVPEPEGSMLARLALISLVLLAASTRKGCGRRNRLPNDAKLKADTF